MQWTSDLIDGGLFVASCKTFLRTFGLILLITVTPVCVADEPSLPARIDLLILQKLGEQQPASRADDAEFLRRVTLDLSGRIPSAEAARQFLTDPAPDKRIRLIDQLLAAPTYAQRMQQLFHVVLMERRGENVKWADYLTTAFEKNKPWDQLVGELLHPDVNDPARNGAGFFFAKRIEADGQNPIDHPGLTRDVSRLFLGTDLQCAQCHNHLFINDYTQLDFQGLYSVFLNVTVKTGLEFPAVQEKPMEKKLDFVSVFDPTQRQTGPRVPFGTDIPIPEVSQEATPVSVLGLLANELPRKENALFSKNIANRLWFVMMGRGLVYPLDLHHSGNPASHPELLDLLASDLAAHQYDIKWFLRELALTETYQRSSRLPGQPNQEPTQFQPQSYLIANEKRLLAEQLLYSSLQATGNLERLLVPAEDGKPNAEFTELRTKYVAAFANEPREPEDEINHTVKGALFTLNDQKILGLLERQPGNLMDRLLPMTDNRQLAEELYLAVWTRRPLDQEVADLDQYLQQHTDQREKSIALWAWAMLTSSEFVVNH